MKRSICCAALFCLAPLTSWAAGFSGVSTIKTIHIEGTAFVSVIPTSGAFSNPDSCGSSSIVMVQSSVSYYQNMLALLAEAYASGTNVQFYLNGCASTPWGYTVPIVWSMDLNP
jgi:hypothetical protein